MNRTSVKEYQFDKIASLYDDIMEDNDSLKYQSEPINKLIDIAIESKRHLIDVLSKMDGWNEDELRVKIDFETTTQPKWDKVISALDGLYSSSTSPIDNKYRIIRDLFKSELFRTETADDIMVLVFAKLGYKIGKGLKMTRAIEKINADYEEAIRTSEWMTDYSKQHQLNILNQSRTALGDNMLTRQVNKTVYLSVSPYDFTRMSVGNSWDSCHYPTNGYGSGALSYAMDELTMICYEEASNGVELVNRRVAWFGDNELMFGRLYGGDSMNSIIEKAVADIFGESSLTERSPSLFPYDTTKNSNHYQDYASHNTRRYCYDSLPWLFDCNMTVGAKAFCVNCGTSDHNLDGVTCSHCTNLRECEHCGDEHSEDDMYYVDGYGWVCDDCAFVCSHCGNAHLVRDSVDSEDGLICEGCYGDHYVTCDRCGCVMRDYNANFIEDEETGYTEVLCNDCMR